jgi:hypothetical protein
MEAEYWVVVLWVILQGIWNQSEHLIERGCMPNIDSHRNCTGTHYSNFDVGTTSLCTLATNVFAKRWVETILGYPFSCHSFSVDFVGWRAQKMIAFRCWWQIVWSSANTYCVSKRAGGMRESNEELEECGNPHRRAHVKMPGFVGQWNLGCIRIPSH